MNVALMAVAAYSTLAFVPAPLFRDAPRHAIIQRAASRHPGREASSSEFSWAPALAVAAAVLLGAQAGYAKPSIASWSSSVSKSDQVDFVTNPPVPRAVLEEKQMTKVKLDAAPSRSEIAQKVRQQEMEYMRSTYVPGGPKPARIVSM